MSDKKKTNEQRVSEWLASEGYRLEYLTHAAFKKVGIHATMSYYVETPDGKPREIDVAAFLESSNQTSKIILRVLCECKYSMDKPWVLMLSDLSSHLFADWISIPQSKPLQDLSSTVSAYEKELEGCWHFAKGQRFAHNILQAFREKKRDTAYDSLQKISNASWDCAETPERRGSRAYVLAIPCLVVEAPLFVSWYDTVESKFQVKKVLYGRLSWDGCRGGTVVDVIHISAVIEYAKAIKTTFSKMISVISKMSIQ